jgi:ATP-dependent helicase Lhr and Lhr-like helicase
MSTATVEALEGFSPHARRWFDSALGTPTPAQTQGWPPIAAGEHTLLCAPTGSGKTLAAFLWFLDQLMTEPGEGLRVLYVSPLKALNYDVERNLRAPLAGIRASAAAAGVELPAPLVAVRTGDTSQEERRRMLRTPPDILITTPESLYLMLTSRAREMLTGVEAVIVDEVHAVAATKRGAHLALSLERLAELAENDPQRVALSATQRPLEEIARFVGGDRSMRIVDAGMRKALDLRIEMPADHDESGETEPVAYVQGANDGGSHSMWPALYPELVELVRTHRSTIVFVNSRRMAERLALRLNELSDEPVARAHHGSLSREARSEVEEALKAGTLPCIVATSSLELGIDMGAVDLVVQVSSPGSVASGLQRVGRAGHSVGTPSRGRIYPRFRGELVEAAAVARGMLEGEVEHTRVPRIPLDVLCQQIVAMASVEELHIDELHALVRRAYPYRELTREQLENVLDLLAGRYPSDEFAELRPRIVWERTTGSLRAREGAQRIAIANAGTIPDRGLYGVFLVDGGGRVGELDEEMVHEAREGQVFLLGASAWRIEQIERDRVIVSPAPGQPAQVPFWKGEQAGRPLELGRAVGRLQRELAALDDESAVQRLMGLHACDERAARTLVEYLREQELATGVLPSDRTIVVERFRDEIGDWRLCILSPFGAKVHAPWGLALRALLREQHGIETHALWSDDGIILHLPDADSLPPDELVAIDPERIEDLVVGELGGSSLFGARFRESAARALLIPRRRPGQRTPLWQQRLRAQSLLAVAERYGSFPILLETYRELLADHFDLGALRELLSGLRDGSRRLVAVESQTASPFAASLNFEYVAQYLYEDDAPAAERRVAALTLDRDLLRELAGSDELRDLLDADALEQVELELGGERRGGPDALHDLLRRVGDLAEEELATRLPGDRPGAVAELLADRRAVRLRIGGADRLIAAEDIGRYRDALGTMPPGGVPAAFLEPVPDALRSLVARFARWRGPFPTRLLAERYDLEPAVAERELAALERAGALVHGALRPGGSGSEWCDVEVLRRIRRASVARLRREVEAVEQPALARFSLAWHGAGRTGRGGIERLREVLFPLQRLPLAPEVWERQVLPLRMDYRPELLDQLCTSGEVVWLGADAGRVAIAFREDAALLGPPHGQASPPADPAAETVRAALQGARHLSELASDTGLPEADIIEALWRLVAAGEVTNDAWEPLRRARRAPTPRTLAPRHGTRRLTRRRPAPRGAALGRWAPTAPLLSAAIDEPDRRRALAELLLERHGVLVRAAVVAEGVPGGPAGLRRALGELETLGVSRRGYLVDGLGGAQHALPGAIERLREVRDPVADAPTVALAASDPANPYGVALRWPAHAAGRASRAAGATVVLRNGEPLAFLERGARTLLSLQPLELADWAAVAQALAAASLEGRVGSLQLERIDGEPAAGSAVGAAFTDAGFVAGPRRLTLRARR